VHIDDTPQIMSLRYERGASDFRLSTMVCRDYFVYKPKYKLVDVPQRFPKLASHEGTFLLSCLPFI
jgi:hypothetical protein